MHHIVEQRIENLNRFGKYNIHSTGNTVRIPKEMHDKISKIYSTQTIENKNLFKKITGHDPCEQPIRNYMNGLDFDTQYEIGNKIINYFKNFNGKKYEIERI